MGVPMTAWQQVIGRIFVMRDDRAPLLSSTDMYLVDQIAATLGARLPALLSGYNYALPDHERVSHDPIPAPGASPVAAPRHPVTSQGEVQKSARS